ncbi:hypothetical protein BDQ17DRAFT_1327962 [Cyathus striatus]|nr:hypothetical protein BDQ17DRAFT_1327962 [Cyathus striatus]
MSNVDFSYSSGEDSSFMLSSDSSCPREGCMSCKFTRSSSFPLSAEAISSQVTLPWLRFLELLLPEYNSTPFSPEPSQDFVDKRSIQSFAAEYSNPSTQKSRFNVFLNILNAMGACSGTYFRSEYACHIGYVIVGLHSEGISQEHSSNISHLLEASCFFLVDHELVIGRYFEDSPEESMFDDKNSSFTKEKQLSCANYAARLLSSGGRRNALGAYVFKNHMILLYYDRSKIITSEPFYWLNDFEIFTKIIHTFAFLDSSFDTSIFSMQSLLSLPNISSSGDMKPQKQLLVRLNELDLLPLETIYRRPGMIGFSTWTCRARVLTGQHKDRTVVIKLSYTLRGGNSEARIVLQYRGQAASNEEYRDKYNLYDLHVTVSEELLPINKVTGDITLGKIFEDILECHHWLYSEMKLLHRDISASNLMYREQNNVVYGVLNDFNLATFLPNNESGPYYITTKVNITGYAQLSIWPAQISAYGVPSGNAKGI